MTDQRMYGLDLTALDADTFATVKRQLDRVSALETVESVLTLQYQVERKARIAAEAALAEQLSNVDDTVFAKLAKVLARLFGSNNEYC